MLMFTSRAGAFRSTGTHLCWRLLGLPLLAEIGSTRSRLTRDERPRRRYHEA